MKCVITEKYVTMPAAKTYRYVKNRCEKGTALEMKKAA